MKKYLLIIHENGPCVGAVEVPSCFEILPLLQQTAIESNMSVLLVTEEELATKGGLEGLLLAQGSCILNALRALMTDPHALDRFDPTLN